MSQPPPAPIDQREYLSVLVSIIVGLGVSHLLAGVGRMVVARRLVRLYWVSLAMAAVVFLAHVQWWWSTIYSGEHLADNFFGFVFFLLAPVALYLLAVLVLPDFDDLTGPVSLRDHYYANHRWFYGVGALLPLLNALRNVFIEGAPVWNEDRPFELLGFLLMLGGAIVRSPRYHAFLAVAGFFGFLAMVVATSLRPG
jgi:hypothetical protein